MGLNQWSELLR